MKKCKKVFFLLMVLITTTIFGQKEERYRMTKKQAKEMVYFSLSDTTSHNVIGKYPILKDKSKAIAFAESILWSIYGKKIIERQKPYDVFLIDTYWLIKGTMPKGMKGGVFTIIIDSKNCKIIRITHGK